MPREEEIMEKISDLEILCENIKTLRVKNNLSEQEMAARLKIGVKTLRNIEKGHFPPRMSCEILFRIQHHFGILPQHLFISIENQ
jgi:DNA-binding transcriptional regulator YiaG